MRKKIILLGSGGMSIGQAGEFDYSGNQAIRALSEEGIHTIVINPNIATVQTNPDNNVTVYLYPVNPFWVTKVIEKERPDAIIGSFGGQTALNCLIELNKSSILKKFNVKNLGTSIDTLEITEDRQLFADRMKKISIPVPPSQACNNVEDGKQIAESLQYPVIVRCAYALGGLGSGFANNHLEFETLATQALQRSPQILVEKSLLGWKEIEYEVMRDSDGNCITICNMENFDPLGVHTGDSIVVTPSQSLTDLEYQNLRKQSLKIINNLGIVGECNAQFALCPKTSKYYIIEVNARLSRSSALASKASGYPIAYVAAKVILGKTLTDLKNPVTQITSAFYEPSLDYITVKFPRWDLKKFKNVSRTLGSNMKSVGEVMGIGRSFPEALQKAVRMVTEDSLGLNNENLCSTDFKETLQANDTRIFDITAAIRSGQSIESIYNKTSVDLWFLSQIKRIIDVENEVKNTTKRIDQKDNLLDTIVNIFEATPAHTIKEWKQLGFSDVQLAYIINKNKKTPLPYDYYSLLNASLKIRQLRHEKNIKAIIKK